MSNTRKVNTVKVVHPDADKAAAEQEAKQGFPLTRRQRRSLRANVPAMIANRYGNK